MSQSFAGLHWGLHSRLDLAGNSLPAGQMVQPVRGRRDYCIWAFVASVEPRKRKRKTTPTCTPVPNRKSCKTNGRLVSDPY